MSVTIRPMQLDDVEAVAAVTTAANDEADREAGREPHVATPEQRARFRGGMRRFVEVDPDGAWVAEDDQGVVAMAEAIRRNTFWGLSMLFVHPRGQSRGIGRQLLDKALAYAEGADVRMIMTSEDPRALRRYSAAGLSIHPAVKAEGKIDRTAIPADLKGREGAAEDLDLVAAVDAGLGRDRTDDVAFLLDDGGRLEIVDEGPCRGFGVHREGRVLLLGATDTDTAATLLWRMLVHAGDDAELYCLTAAQDWAVRVALAARMSVSGGGPLFASGMQPPQAWLPSGWYF